MNLYAYVGNSPLNATDPTGMVRRGEGLSDEEWSEAEAKALATADQAEGLASRLGDAASSLRNGEEADADLVASFEAAFGEGSATARNMSRVSHQLNRVAGGLRGDQVSVNKSSDGDSASYNSINLSDAFFSGADTPMSSRQVRTMFHEGHHAVMMHDSAPSGHIPSHLRPRGMFGRRNTAGPAYREAATAFYNSSEPKPPPFNNSSVGVFTDPAFHECLFGTTAC